MLTAFLGTRTGRAPWPGGGNSVPTSHGALRHFGGPAMRRPDPLSDIPLTILDARWGGRWRDARSRRTASAGAQPLAGQRREDSVDTRQRARHLRQISAELTETSQRLRERGGALRHRSAEPRPPASGPAAADGPLTARGRPQAGIAAAASWTTARPLGVESSGSAGTRPTAWQTGACRPHHGPLAEAQRLGDVAGRLGPLVDPLDETGSTAPRGLGILVAVHPGQPGITVAGAAVSTPVIAMEPASEPRAHDRTSRVVSGGPPHRGAP